MATEVPMPKLGLTMEEATILEWLVADGEHVAADTPIVRIETDKTETEVGSPGTGRLHVIGRPGDVFACGERIGLLLADDEAPPSSGAPPEAPSAAATAAPAGAPSSPPAAPAAAAAVPVSAPASSSVAADGRLLASPNARRVAAERGIALAGVRGTGPDGRIVSEDVEAAPARVAAQVAAPGLAPVAIASNRTAVATVAARALADLLGVDLAEVLLDPVEQRITRDGVALYVRQRLQQTAAPRQADLPPPSAASAAPPAPPGAAAAPPAAPLLQEPVRMVRLSGMRGTIAKRMTASLREMAQLTLAMDADMTAVLADRQRRRAEEGEAASVTDYVLAATARALVRHPDANAQITADGIAVLPDVHVGLAVAVPGGLMVPVVRDAAHRSLLDLSRETTRLAEAARSGSIAPAELEGGTFSVSALGMFGVDMFTPVINPPNAGILGVGRLRDDVVLVDERVSTVKRLTLSLTWDHRVFDGVPAAELCREIVGLLADPSALD
jgi:pyruvate dehydrogenase E2 component (dihydrolipoamide acetyltransferase)